MNEGNYFAKIESRLDELAETEKIYDELREQGLDLYEIDNNLIVLPDAEREPFRNWEGCVTMNKKDWQIYSKIIKKRNVASEMANRNSFFEKNKSDEEIMRKGMEYAWSHLERKTEEGRRMKPFTSEHSYNNSYSLEKLKEAIAGGFPQIEYSGIDLC